MNMKERDEIATINRQHWERTVHKGAGYTIPWLDLDADLFRQHVKGELEPRLEPLGGMFLPEVLTELQADVKGKDVLCLAAGGGQQSAVFGLLGAWVTVLDLAEGQLEGDRRAATHYGYEVTTIRGDMRDLSCLGDESFDLVYGTGMCYVPDVREVYSGIARVLRTEGIYRVDFTNPGTEFVDCDDWDGEGYRIARPYAERMRRRKDGAIEFRHYLADIFNGLIAEGLSIRSVHENPSYLHKNPEAHPGTWAHWQAFVPGFAIIARKELQPF